MEQPQTPDRTNFVKPTATEPTPAEDAAPAPAVALTPIAWLSQNAVYLVVFAVLIGVTYYYLDLEGLFKVAVVILGLGFVVFFHELGHFLAAKWCDVHIQTFSIGFGPAIPGCSFRRGETLYKLAILPLGGYVAMVGEGSEADENEDYPRSFKNKSVGQRMIIISSGVVMNMILGCICFVVVFYFHGVERPKAIVHSIEPASPAWTAGVHSGDRISNIDGKANPTFDDLRLAVGSSWHSSVIPFQFTARYGDRPVLAVNLQPRKEEMDDLPVIGVGSSEKLQLRIAKTRLDFELPVVFGSAAARARVVTLQPGEVVVKATAAGATDTLTPLPGEDGVRWDKFCAWLGERVTTPIELQVAGKSQGVLGPPHAVTLSVEGFQFGDHIVGTTAVDQTSGAYDPLRVEALPLDPEDETKERCDLFVFYKRLRRLAGRPVVIQVRRENPPEGSAPVNLLVPPAYTPVTGMHMDMGRVAGVRANSPAARAKLQEGDVITRVELTGRLSDAGALVVPGPVCFEFARFDPVRLPYDLNQSAGALRGKKTARLTVLRSNPNGQEANGEDKHKASIPVVLDPVEWDETWDDNFEPPTKAASPLSIPQLGVAYWVNCTVAGVDPDSPADKAGIKAGDRIAELRFRIAEKKLNADKVNWSDYQKLESTRANGRTEYDQWAFVSFVMQGLGYLDRPTLGFKVVRDGKPLKGEDGKDLDVIVETRYDPTWPSENLGLPFLADTKLEKATSVLDALALGWKETITVTSHICLSLRNVVTNRVNAKKSFGGPITIAQAAYNNAEDPYRLLLFLGMISINLAILNSLPIPVLDGGHMVLLVYEKIRGKPPSDTWRAVLTYAGLVILLLLMVLATFLDVTRIFKWLQ